MGVSCKEGDAGTKPSKLVAKQKRGVGPFDSNSPLALIRQVAPSLLP